MTQQIAVRESPEAIESIRELEDRFAIAVRQRELLARYIQERLKPEKHYYKVKEGQKDSLTKDGAELICLPHGYRPRYKQNAGPDQPPEDDTPYQITVTCTLMKTDGSFQGEGMGSASSCITLKTGERVVRQKDIGLRHNATLKMAQKSAYIAATLNATAASEFFTQDMEDGAEGNSEQHPTPTKADPRLFCQEHQVEWFKKGKMKNYAHPIGNAGAWCNMPSAKPQDSASATPEPADVPQQVDAPQKANSARTFANLGELRTATANGEGLTEKLSWKQVADAAGITEAQLMKVTDAKGIAQVWGQVVAIYGAKP